MHTIIFRPTNNCNMRCRYCYDGNNHGNNNRKSASELLLENKQFLIKGIKELTKETESPLLVFHGGEPLYIELNALKMLCEDLKKEVPNMRFSLQTNGTLINKDTIEFFKEYQIYPGISLDGPTEAGNCDRVFENGKAAFQTIMEKLALLQQSGIPFGILVSAGKHLIGHEEELYRFVANNHIYCNIHSLFETNKNDNVMSPEEYITFWSNLFDYWFDDPSENVETKQFPNFSEILLQLLKPDILPRGCLFRNDCMKNFVAMDVFGDLYMCNRLYGVEQYKYGNVRELDINSLNKKINCIMEKRNTAIEKKCLDCKYYHVCHGGCPAVCYYAGDFNQISASHCEIIRGVFDHVNRRISEVAE